MKINGPWVCANRSSRGSCKARNTVFRQWFSTPQKRHMGSRYRRRTSRNQVKSNLLLAAVAWSTYRNQNHTNTPGSKHFWKLRRELWVQKVLAFVARSIFPSQKSTEPRVRRTFGNIGLDVETSTFGVCLFLNLRCWECGRKNVSKSRRHAIVRALFWKFRCHCGAKLISKSNCQTHLTPQIQNAFGGCDLKHARAVVARSTFPSPNVPSTQCWEQLRRLR